jgi:Tol biopolymer transport system component
MMQQLRNIPRVIITGFCLLVGFTVASAAAVDVLTGGRGEVQPLQGIRSYGSGAVRQDRPAVAPGTAQSSRAAVGMKISGASMSGAVSAFALTPDGTTAVYIAEDFNTAGLFELYSVAVDGSAMAPTRLTAGLVFGGGDTGVELFQIAPDGAQVVFLADATLGGGMNDLYSVPVDGSLAAVRLNLAAQAPVTAVGVAPNGTIAAFFGSGGGAIEIYRATIGSADSGVQLSDASATAAGNVVAADFSADSMTLLYAADASTVGVYQWYSVPFSAVGPGFDMLLSNAIGSVSLGAISPDSTTLVYTADENVSGVAELFSVPLGGGGSTRLNPAMAGLGVTSLRINGDSTRVAYLADQMTFGIVEVFGAQLGVADSGLRLNTPLSGTQNADAVTIGPDDLTVLYEADENIVGTFDLLSAPIDGSGASSTLDAMTPPASAGFFSGLGTPVLGGRAVYPVVGAAIDLYSIPFDGSQSATRINATLAVGDTVSGIFIPDWATRLAAYGVGPSGGVTEELFVAPIRADLAPEQVNASAASGSLGVLDYGISSTESYAVYLQDQETPGKAELYSAELDSDQDTVGNSTDNCPFVDNVAQTDLPFGQTVRAPDGTSFRWDNAADARYVRGPLASVATLVTDASGTLTDATSLIDAGSPAAGAGFFYLFALDCAGRSYQTALGAEPGRDIAGLP